MNQLKNAQLLGFSRLGAAALIAALGFGAAGCSDNVTSNPGSPDLQRVDLSVAAPDLSATPTGGIVINEVFPHGSNELTDPDWAELKNTGSAPVDLSGYRVRDDKTTATLPAGTMVAPGQYLVLYCDDAPDGGAASAIHLPFKFGGSDEFRLMNPSGMLVDSIAWDAVKAPSGKSYGRLPDGTGQFTAQTPTRGTGNGM